MKKIIQRLVMACMVMASADALAQERGWEWRIVPYFWSMGIDGTIGKGPASVGVDYPFSDAIQDLEVGGMIGLEAGKDRWSFQLDTSYVNVDDKADTGRGRFRFEMEQLIVQGNALYRVTEDSSVSLELGVGGRYIDNDVDVNVPGDRADFSFSKGWVDPLLVARVRGQFAENCFGILTGDIGGFGVESDLTWKLTASVGYSFNETVSILLGYRYLDYDYDQDGLVYDVAISGLMLGVAFDL